MPALATPADIDKLTRIRQLRAHGLNTPRVELIEARTAVDESLRLRLVEIAAGDERMTVRTYRSDDEIGHAKGPFIPEVPVGEAIAAVEELVSGWDILFQEAIDVEETVLAGNLVLSGSGWGRYEVLRGTYRVRDVDDLPGGASKDLAAARFDSLDEIHDPLVRDAAERVVRSGLLYAVSPGMDEPVVLELNVQSAPVGALKEPLLWWEWRPLVPHKQSAHIPAVRATANPTERIWSLGVESLPEPDATDRLALGGKGAGLACARSRGLPTPPAFVLSPPVDPAEIGELQLGAAVEALLEEGQSRLGRSPDTARLAVRSSPVDSMPGMLDTVLDVEPTTDAVWAAVGTVLESWSSERARLYRRMHRLGESDRLAVVVQQMIFADADVESGSGVGFTRDPRTGVPNAVIEYVSRSRGTPLVSGRLEPERFASIETELPDGWQEVSSWLPTLESIGGDVQEFEFAFERSHPFLLQTRSARLTPKARLLSAFDLCREHRIDEPRAARAGRWPGPDPARGASPWGTGASSGDR